MKLVLHWGSTACLLFFACSSAESAEFSCFRVVERSHWEAETDYGFASLPKLANSTECPHDFSSECSFP